VAILAKQPKGGTTNLISRDGWGQEQARQGVLDANKRKRGQEREKQQHEKKLVVVLVVVAAAGDWWTIWWRFAGKDDSKTP